MYLAAVQLDETAADRQAQTCPFGTFDDLPGGLHLLKFVKDLGLIFGPDSDSRITDGRLQNGIVDLK